MEEEGVRSGCLSSPRPLRRGYFRPYLLHDLQVLVAGGMLLLLRVFVRYEASSRDSDLTGSASRFKDEKRVL